MALDVTPSLFCLMKAVESPGVAMLARREIITGLLALALTSNARAQPNPSAPGAVIPLGPAPPPLWGPGYSREQLLHTERRFGFRFPPDLLEFLLQRRFARSPDWTKDGPKIRELLDWPLQGTLLDIERFDAWPAFWGPRPDKLEDRIRTAERLVRAAPKLIPLGPNHFMPETPHEPGNPVFRVFLSEVRYSGSTLADYVQRLTTPGALRRPVAGAKKEIPFWTEMTKVIPPQPKPSPRKPTATPQIVPGERG